MSAPTLDDLLALLPDNTDGEISAADMRDVVTALYDRTNRVGQVASDGTLEGGPDGWTAEWDGDAKLYTVHHDLGTEAYAVAVTPLTKTAQGISVGVYETGTDYFTYGIWNHDENVLHQSYANFVVGLL